MRRKSVGRIASCASGTWRAPERWTLGLGGRYASPKRSSTTCRTAPPERNIGHLPQTLPRVDQVIEPHSTQCPCGCAQMVRIGEDRTERLDIVPAQLRGIVTVRPKYAGRCANKALPTGVCPVLKPAVPWRGKAVRVRLRWARGSSAPRSSFQGGSSERPGISLWGIGIHAREGAGRAVKGVGFVIGLAAMGVTECRAQPV